MTHPSNTSVTAQFGAGERGEPVAWGRVIDGRAVTVSLERTPANDEPLYAAPVSHTSVKDGGSEEARAIDRNALALALYAKWIIEAHGDADPSQWTAECWNDWQQDHLFNAVGLTKKSFLEEADWLLNLIGQHHDLAQAPEQPTGSDAVADGALEETKLVYVKRWRTIVGLPKQYADEIVEALRSAPVKDGGSEVMRECDWPANTPFKFLDEPGEHEPCYVVMPGGAMLPLNHHVGEGVDIARAKFIVAACNAALVSADSNDEFYELGKRDGYEDAIQDLDIATGGDGEFKGSTIPGETVDVPTMKARIISRAVPARATSAHHARAIAEILDPVAFDPISLRNDQHPTWMCRRETAIETANKILSLAPVKAVGSEALREARIAELEGQIAAAMYSTKTRLADLREANETYGKASWDRSDAIERNNREIRWLRDFRAALTPDRKAQT